ncbi:hypothetical protein [Fundidesulfovibrio agrisoli]|uniref:hypothetical protein n=1 Tax=Fundidesulfovibrio agrisoli TaxID=2922717 RepID=UPI001FACA003|nr:hypothetical protein [Fundidesulfovibrio agrisoli]
MNREDLERQALQGEEVARLLECDAVRVLLEGQLSARREAILALDPGDAPGFTRLKAGLAALEEFLAGLHSLAAAGEQARERLASEANAGRGRVL